VPEARSGLDFVDVTHTRVEGRRGGGARRCGGCSIVFELQSCCLSIPPARRIGLSSDNISPFDTCPVYFQPAGCPLLTGKHVPVVSLVDREHVITDSQRNKRKLNGVQQSATSLAATGARMPYGITRCYLPPGRGDIPAVNYPSRSWYSIKRPRRDARLS